MKKRKPIKQNARRPKAKLAGVQIYVLMYREWKSGAVYKEIGGWRYPVGARGRYGKPSKWKALGFATHELDAADRARQKKFSQWPELECRWIKGVFTPKGVSYETSR